MREFHLGDVLSITTGHLVSPRQMEGVYDILNYMTGEDLFTSQIPRATTACAGLLLAQHPDLADVRIPDDGFGGSGALVNAWLDEQMQRFGETRQVTPLAAGSYIRMDVYEEILKIRDQ